MAKIVKSAKIGIQKQNLFITKVDSTLLSIPLSKCEIVDSNLIDLVSIMKVNVSTGEIISEDKKQGDPYVKRYNGISFKIWIKYQFDYIKGEKVPIPYINFLANAKQLEAPYFEGITKDTFRYYFDLIMALNVFKCSYNDFKTARFSDTDICFDFKANEKEFDVLKTNIRNSVLDNRLVHTTNSKTNSGIWTPSQREPRKQATPGKPYILF